MKEELEVLIPSLEIDNEENKQFYLLKLDKAFSLNNISSSHYYSSPINYLDFSDMETLNDISRKMFNEKGIYGVKDKEKLESILSRIENSNIFGKEILPTVVHKAVKLFYEISSNQVFYNGNKRAALLSFVLFLKYNYLVFNHDNYLFNNIESYLYNLSKDVANKKVTKEELFGLTAPLLKYDIERFIKGN